MTGMEIATEAAIKGLASILATTAGKTGINLLGKAGGAIWDGAGKLSQQAWDSLRPISQKYVENYTDRHGILKVLGMRKPVSLDEVYTAVQFLNPEAIRSFESIEALEGAFRERGRQSKDAKKLSGIGVANDEQYLMVLGGPGAGKSTFLRKVGLEALKGKRKEGYQHTSIPVFLELKRFRSGEIDLEGAIAEEFKNCCLPKYQELTVQLLEQGRLLILLDGLDEVPTERMSETVTYIQDFVDRHKENRFITSCRVAAYRHNFRHFTDVTVADFEDKQIEEFITNWFNSCDQPDWGKECWQKLNSGDYAAAKELTHTPLLLTLICLLFQRTGQFPTKRASLYSRALWVLLEEWDAGKEIPREKPYKGLDTKCKELMLSEIAYDGFKEDRLFLEKRELAGQIEQLLGEMLPDEKFIDGRAVLRAIEVQHGILVERAEDVYSFSHLTLQEFLTAQYLFDDDDLVQKLITHHLTHTHWREVFLLLAGLKKRTDNLLVKMEEQAQSYITDYPKLQELLTWADRVTAGSEGDIKPVGKRAVAIALANALAYAIANAKALADANANALAYANALADANANALADANAKALAYALAYAIAKALANALAYTNTLDEFIRYARICAKLKIYPAVNLTELIARLEKLKAQIPKESGKVHQAFAERIIKTWLEAFHLSPEKITLSEEELKALDNYCYANLLVVQCKEAAVRVSRDTWEDIEKRMLLPQAKIGLPHK